MSATTPSRDPLATCPVCGSPDRLPALSHQAGLTTDLRLTNTPLKKIQCTHCGLVRSASAGFLENFYQHDYQKAESDRVTAVLSGSSAIAFSSLIEQWVRHLAPGHLTPAHTILEVGCGDGRLLHRFDATRKVGLEPSAFLYKLAKENCSECVLLHCGIDEYDDSEQFDVILAVNVFEHLPDPRSFLTKLRGLLKDDGIAILIFPTQEQFNYDVCFIDHLFHMRLGHLQFLAEECGLRIAKQEVGYQSYQVANAVLLQKSPDGVHPKSPLAFLENENPRLMAGIFEHFAEVITEQGRHMPIVAFGHGELCKVFEAYAEGFDRVSYFIDDYYRGSDARIVSLAVALERGILYDAFVVFLANPSYRDYIVGKLQVPRGPSHVYFPISGETIRLGERDEH